jgi:hypothetical protein
LLWQNIAIQEAEDQKTKSYREHNIKSGNTQATSVKAQSCKVLRGQPGIPYGSMFLSFWIQISKHSQDTWGRALPGFLLMLLNTRSGIREKIEATQAICPCHSEHSIPPFIYLFFLQKDTFTLMHT